MKKSFWLVLLCVSLFVTTGFKHKKASVVAPPAEKINLVWQADVPDQEANFNNLPKITGINVVSPCWLEIATTRGLIKNKIPDKKAVTMLKQKGYKVWPLITNSFNPTLTHALLSNPDARENLRIGLLNLADKYQFDGYNFDFENINDQDRDGLTTLIKELSPVLKAKNLVLSMDVTMPSSTPNWSACYDRQELAKYLDYIMLMAYDQYTPAMRQRGSTASLNWVTAGLESTLKQIPAEKLILGIPLYSRLWQSSGTSSYATGKTISMPAMEKTIQEQKATPVWKPELGQFYVEYQKNGITYSFWQENANSIVEKVKLVDRYKLPGIACWRKGFETEDIWPSIDSTLNPNR